MHRCALAVLAAFVLAWPWTAAAQDPEAPPPRHPCTSFRLLSPGCRTVELYGGHFVEVWNFNGRRKVTLPGVAAVVSTSNGNGWGTALEILGTSVRQPGPNTFVSGLSVMVRKRLLDRGPIVIFTEGGVGGSYSTAVVPQNGTRFNYLAHGGLGVAAYLAPRVGLIVSTKLFHLSNASLDGPNHNPDIEALGGRLGMFVTF